MKKKLQNEELDDRAKRRNTNYCNRKIVLINVKVGSWWQFKFCSYFIYTYIPCIEFDKNHKWKKCENLKENTYYIFGNFYLKDYNRFKKFINIVSKYFKFNETFCDHKN